MKSWKNCEQSGVRVRPKAEGARRNLEARAGLSHFLLLEEAASRMTPQGVQKSRQSL